MIKSICILGGGTSGMITALMLKKAYPSMKVKIIESSQVGIVGVGEGSTEHWRFFIDYTDISVSELFQETDATFKIGIKFNNWHGDNTHYFHSLMIDFGTKDRNNGLYPTWLRMIGEKWSPLNTLGKGSQMSRHYEPLHNNINQYHFDTFKLNNFFHKKCKERDIEITDQIINDVQLDEHGFVDSLIDTAGNKHHADFFVDCSGFKRLIANKLGVKWLDKSNHLPMNSAIAFPTDYLENIPSYTEATALSSGWSWRIPTQNRFGNGYVYCDHFISDDLAVQEISNHYRDHFNIEKINIGKKFKFSAGYVDNFWIKNCVTIGLSSMFVEPLEASSIGTSIQQTSCLITVLQAYNKENANTAKQYNKVMHEVANNIIDFLQLHYFTQRRDTEFWKFCSQGLEWTDFNKENLNYFSQGVIDPNFFREPLLLFKELNFCQVMYGLRLLNSDIPLNVYDYYFRENYDESIKKMLELNDDLNGSIPHRQCIEILKNRTDKITYKF